MHSLAERRVCRGQASWHWVTSFLGLRSGHPGNDSLLSSSASTLYAFSRRLFSTYCGPGPVLQALKISNPVVLPNGLFHHHSHLRMRNLRPRHVE